MTDSGEVIEGYRVVVAEKGDSGGVKIKEEPKDSGYESSSKSSAALPDTTTSNTADENSEKIRSVLMKLMDSKKQVTTKDVLEYLQKNELINMHSGEMPRVTDTEGKPRPKRSESISVTLPSGVDVANSSSATVNSGPVGGNTRLLQPKSPTRSCSIPANDMAHISHALVEVAVDEQKGDVFINNQKREMVCAVGSKIKLMTPEGITLQVDVTCYWCNFCSFRSEKKDSLLQHIMEHRFTCKYCNYQSFSRADVIHHCKNLHEAFADTAKDLKYCMFLPDYLQLDEQKDSRKRALSEDKKEGSHAKVLKTDGIFPETKGSAKGKSAGKKDDFNGLEMEVEEVETDNTHDDAVVDDTPTPPRRMLRKPRVGPKSVMERSGAKGEVQLPAAVVTPELIGQPPLKTATSTEIPVPVITSVMSGHLAVAAATGVAPAPSPQKLAPTPPKVTEETTKKGMTVNNGLCWNCGYCPFVTLSQAYLKIHLNGVHPGQAHKYVAMLAPSEEEMNRIKEQDNKMMQNPGGIQPIPITAPAKMIPSSSTSQIEIDNAEKDVNAPSDEVKIKQERDIPQSYKCAHCNFSSPMHDKVKVHLLQRHPASVLYALDMRAVKLHQKRYLFFCLKNRCEFNTKEVDEYKNHTSSCTPWLEGKETKGVDQALIKALELTLGFAVKMDGKTTSALQEMKSDKDAEYGCIHCSYVSNNNTRLKKHMLSNHKDKPTVIKDLLAKENHRKVIVYFCKHCLWESREGSELEIHLRDKHQEEINQEAAAAATASISSRSANITPASSLQPVTPKPSTSGVTPTTPGTASAVKPLLKKRGRKPKIKELFTSPDSSEESANESFSEPEVEKDDENPDEESAELALNIPDEEVERAMEAYIADETSKSSSRPTREAAQRAQIKVRTHGHTPPLFRCIYCTEIAFGVNMIRKHIRAFHKDMPLRALDVKKKMTSQASYFCFCPNLQCQFSATNAQDVVAHGKKDHGFASSEKDLSRLQDVFVPPKTLTTSMKFAEQYECLYCTKSFIVRSKELMKLHMQSAHAKEDFVFRDVIARKQRKQSRFYMCSIEGCLYCCAEQKEYSLHTLGHQKAHIYECAKCQWFTVNPDQVANHMVEMHKGQMASTVEIDLDLDQMGNIVKTIGGTTIKKERS